MYKRIAIVLLGVILPALCLAQGGGFFRNRGGGQVGQLVEEVWALQQFDTLALSDAQLSAALALYKQYPPEVPAELKPLTDKLTEARARLLTGTPLPAGDMTALFQEYRTALGQTRGGPGGQNRQQQDNQPVKLSPLAEALWGLLTQSQKAVLLGDVRQAAANNQKADRVSAQRAIKQIGRLRAADDATWATTEKALADALSAAAGEPGTPARNNSFAMFQEFLSRLRQMSDAEFGNKQTELETGLMALMPPGSSITVAMSSLDLHAIQNAMGNSFLSPRAPVLLEELQAGRANTTPAQ